jgi:hypothetical protein
VKTYLEDRYPRAYSYLRRFEKVLQARRSRGVSDMLKKGAPFYTMFSVGDYTFAPWKVVWREVAHTLDAAVAPPHDDRPSIPDHTLILIGCGDEDEAHYLCSVLNSAPARLGVQAYIVLHPDPHILERVCIPRFDPKNRVHQRLAELSAQAHEAARNDDALALTRVEAEIDRLAARLWGLTDQELAEIQRSLQELVAGESSIEEDVRSGEEF